MDKTAIISGASGAVGSSLVKNFLAHGYTVDGLFRKLPAGNIESGFTAHSVDLLNEGAVASTVSSIIAGKSAIDVLVCTAGGFAGGHIETTDSAALVKQYNINFLTAYHLVRPVYLQMKKQGYGRIFLIGSRQGSDGAYAGGAVAYGLSKSLLFHLAQTLNTDGKGKVVVTMIVPSTVDTAANRRDMPDADFSRWVTNGDIASAILFYASEEASAIRHPIISLFKDS